VRVSHRSLVFKWCRLIRAAEQAGVREARQARLP
jgi:hypothetical protein